MSEDDTNERGDLRPGEPGANDQASGFHLEVGLGLLSGLLGNLRKATAHNSRQVIPGHQRAVGNRSSRRPKGGATSDHERTQREPSARTDDHLIDTRIDDDEFVVTADIPGATRDDLSVGIRPRTNDLEIARDGTVLRRIDIPWRAPEATRVWFNNGVLEVRLQPSET